MHVTVDLSIFPIGVGNTLSPYILACERVLREAGLEPQMHANGTNFEGEWNTVFEAVRRCHQTLHAMGAPRVAANLRLGSRSDRHHTLADKLASVEAERARQDTPPATQ